MQRQPWTRGERNWIKGLIDHALLGSLALGGFKVRLLLRVLGLNDTSAAPTIISCQDSFNLSFCSFLARPKG